MNKLDIQHNMLQNYYHTASLPMFHKKKLHSNTKLGKSVDDILMHRLNGKKNFVENFKLESSYSLVEYSVFPRKGYESA